MQISGKCVGLMRRSVELEKVKAKKKPTTHE